MIPAIYTLLQGLSIFTAVYQIVAESETTSFAVGLSSLFTAILANADWLSAPCSAATWPGR